VKDPFQLVHALVQALEFRGRRRGRRMGRDAFQNAAQPLGQRFQPFGDTVHLRRVQILDGRFHMVEPALDFFGGQRRFRRFRHFPGTAHGV
jgi:hypothetical protein